MSQPDDLNKPEEELDPYWQSHRDTQQSRADYYNNQDEDVTPAVDNSEQQAQIVEPEEEEDTFSDAGDVVRGVAETALQPVLGVADFASDAVGLVPWLKPIDEWWDNNSYRSTHAGHKLLRDASSIIIPTLAGGGWLVGGAKASIAARAITLPKYAHTLGTVAAYTGVDTGVAMISSHSKTDDNMAATLNNWLGWGLPWATRPGDDPDTRWKKNVMEAAGFAGGVELLGAALTFGKKAKLIPRDAAAEELISAKRAKVEEFGDPLTASVEPRRQARTAAQTEEMIDAIKADPSGMEYNAFVNDLGEDSAGKAVVNLEPDPLQAKLHNAQIQQNVGTLNGRAAPVVSEAWQKKFKQALSSSDRASQLDELFDSISPNFDAIVTNGAQPIKITAEQMNRSVDNLTSAIYGKDISLKEFEFIVDDMKTTIFNSNQVLDEESWIVASQAFKNAFDTLFDPNQMRASGMLAQQTADTITDTATAAKMLGENIDTSRQMGIIFDKLDLLGREVKANDFIVRKAQEYKKIVQSGGEIDTVVRWMNAQAENFDEYLQQAKATSSAITDELKFIAKEHPNYYKPFKEAYDATNGSVDQLHKLHRWTEEHIGLIKKGFIDQNPEVPSLVVKGLHAARINSVLSGLSPIRAAVGNSTLSAVKPVSVFAGAVLTGNQATLKRAAYTFGGISENIKRGFKVMRDEWNLAKQHPEEAMMRGRVDLRMSKMENMEVLDSMADGWKADGEFGKVAMWNIAKGLSWWNKQWFVRYGTNALYAIDGFTNSLNASGMARARAYDELFEATKGAIDFDEFNKLQRKLYNNAFDETGLLTDEAAKYASREIALNLDNKVTKRFEDFLDHVPAARGLFLFPRTGVNALELGWSFNPMSNLGPAMTRARRALGARTAQEKLAVLAEHGIDAAQDADLAFATLKSEYIGRQIMGSTVVMGVGLWALEGNVTGSGPQNAAERRRMMSMGWQPYSIKNPITGEWRSYKGFEPFDTLMGLTADVVYQANRIDQALTEDFFRKISYSISMNITNDTFVSGFEPLVGLISGDAGAWTRFWAGQTDMMTPYKGMRTILNNAITPQLKDVNNDYLSYLQNSNKYVMGNNLENMLDIYTGKPIRYQDPLTAAFNAVLPMFKQNGDMEPWRQWLLSSGWDGLQQIRKNPYTGETLDARDRQFLNNWIAKNADLKGQIMGLMTEGDGFWNKKMKEYKKFRGMKTQAEFPYREWILHKELDRIHNRAFTGAWNALEAYNEQYTTIGREAKNRNYDLNRGRGSDAANTQGRVKNLLQETRY